MNPIRAIKDFISDFGIKEPPNGWVYAILIFFLGLGIGGLILLLTQKSRGKK